MNNKKTARLYTSKAIAGVLAKVSSKEQKRTEQRMLLAAKIADAIEAKGWTRKEFAERLDKHPSEVTKWLSGTHNFTHDTLIDIQEELDIKLISLEPAVTKVVYQLNVTVVAQKLPVEYFQNYGNLLSGATTDFSLQSISKTKEKAYA